MNKSSNVLLFHVFLISIASTAEPALTTAEAEENSWNTKSSMPQAASGVKAAAVNGKIYVMAGKFNCKYDPAMNKWSVKKPMPTPRDSFGITVFQNKIYVIGGEDEALSSKGYYFMSTNEVYDPSTDTGKPRSLCQHSENA